MEPGLKSAQKSRFETCICEVEIFEGKKLVKKTLKICKLGPLIYVHYNLGYSIFIK